MPYKSNAQRRWAHTKKGTKALGGKKVVKEFDEESKGKKLPEKARARVRTRTRTSAGAGVRSQKLKNKN